MPETNPPPPIGTFFHEYVSVCAQPIAHTSKLRMVRKDFFILINILYNKERAPGGPLFINPYKLSLDKMEHHVFRFRRIAFTKPQSSHSIVDRRSFYFYNFPLVQVGRCYTHPTRDRNVRRYTIERKNVV